MYDGDTERAIDVYRDSLIKNNKGFADDLRPGTGEIKTTKLEVLDKHEYALKECGTGDFVKLRIHYETYEPVENPVFNVTMHILNSHQVTGIRTDVDGVELGTLEGKGFVDIDISNLNLLPNVYTIDSVIFYSDGVTYYDRVNKTTHLRVVGGLQINGTTYLPHVWVDGKEGNGRTPTILPSQLQQTKVESET